MKIGKALYSCSGFVSVCPLGQLTMENIYDMYAMPKHRLAPSADAEILNKKYKE